MIAALYVDPRGVYAGLGGVVCYGLPDADARGYDGPLPVVAHPPCAAWGRYAKLSPESRARGPLVGDDGGCFAAALAAVRAWGGVLEHPAYTRAFTAFGLGAPLAGGGWSRAPGADGWVCHVEQGHYGHAARKPTWLYYVGDTPAPMVWGQSQVEARPWAGARGVLECLSQRQRAATPLAFARALVGLAVMA